jgi:LysM repeat protein
MARYRGRHRAPSTTGRTLARTALAGAVAGAPLLATAPAYAVSDSTWDKLAQCESTGRWNINTGNGFSGGLQFTPSTWRAFGGGQFASVAHQASREQQIVVAERVLAQQGWNAWPSCSKKIGASGGATLRSAPSSPAKVVNLTKPAPAPATAPAATTGAYVVKAGDSLSRIAATNNIVGGWQELVKKNPALAANPNVLKTGQNISL